MRLRNRPFVYEAAAQLGLPQMLHWTFFQKQVTIVMYHAVVQSRLRVYNWCYLDTLSFSSQVEYLRRKFNVISLSDAVDRMRSGEIQHPTAVITFDDGFQNNYDFALPILRQAELPATVFLTTGLIDTDDTVWFCRLNRALTQTDRSQLDWDGRRFALSDPGDKVQAAVAIQARLKEYPQPRLLAELHRIIRKLGDDPDCGIEVGSPFRMLSRDAIVDMLASGLIEFGAHTHTHAILSHLSPRRRHAEIELSLAAVSNLTGRPCELFAYPNGGPLDYDAETIATLQALGVRAAVTTIAGPNDSRTPVMELRRYGIGANSTIGHFQCKVHHFRSHFLNSASGRLRLV